MSWRSPDWEKLKLEATIALLKRIKPKRKPTGEQLFEAGADALLEALERRGILLEKGILFKEGELWLTRVGLPHLDLEGIVTSQGYLVFIPEEET